NDDITLQLKRGEIHALLGENGAGKSTLMSVLFGMYQPEKGEIRKDGKKVEIKDPNDATELGIGMVHQHFKLVECFSVLDNIILGVEPNKLGFLKKAEAKKKVMELSKHYGLAIDPDAIIEDITVGMQQRTEILKMLYRDNEVLIFDEPTAVLTPQEIEELMQIMRNLKAEGKSILFISHKLNEIMAVADRCTVLRKGRYIGTVETANTTVEELSAMMVGRNVNFHVEKQEAKIGDTVLKVRNVTVASKVHKNNAVKDVSFDVHAGEILCIAGIDGNGQTEFVHGLTGLEPLVSGSIELMGRDITKASIRKRSTMGMSHIPEDRHKHGLVLDYTLEDNLVLQRYFEPEFTNGAGFLRRANIRKYAEKLIDEFDIRSGQGPVTIARAMSGGNQQKAIVAREMDKDPELLVAVQPTRGLDVGAIEHIHKQLVKKRDEGKAVLLISLELDEVMDVPDRIIVMYEGEIVGELDPKNTTQEELGLYMSGAKRDEVKVQ
ncbi:MAG: ABC transporter ATP-binding protein, partial [Clostridia bacterium]|nr:ABC transporter ATP-binding protein [Clostridia bacterium]